MKTQNKRNYSIKEPKELLEYKNQNLTPEKIRSVKKRVKFLHL